MTLPDSHTLVRGQLVMHSDFPLPSHHRLLEELTARRSDVTERLAMPGSDEPIHVYLFDDAELFAAFMRLYHPEFPSRRAFFVETDTRLLVYAQWGDRVAEDLRHEVAHGYLHSVVSGLPLWLDEGLAEYFEVPRGHRGLNQTHIELLRERIEKKQWQPDLARLESLDRAFDLTQEDYAECWAWVHFLLEASAEHRELLHDYLRDLREHSRAKPLWVRLERATARPDLAVVEHIGRLSSSSRQ